MRLTKLIPRLKRSLSRSPNDGPSPEISVSVPRDDLTQSLLITSFIDALVKSPYWLVTLEWPGRNGNILTYRAYKEKPTGTDADAAVFIHHPEGDPALIAEALPEG